RQRAEGVIDRAVRHATLRRELAHGESFGTFVDCQALRDVKHLVEVMYTWSRHESTIMEHLLHKQPDPEGTRLAAIYPETAETTAVKAHRAPIWPPHFPLRRNQARFDQHPVHLTRDTNSPSGESC